MLCSGALLSLVIIWLGLGGWTITMQKYPGAILTSQQDSL